MPCVREPGFESLVSRRIKIRTVDPSVFDEYLMGKVKRYLQSGQFIATGGRNRNPESGSVFLVELESPVPYNDFLSKTHTSLRNVVLVFWGSEPLETLLNTGIVSTNDVHLYALRNEEDSGRDALTLDDMYGIATETEVTVVE